MNILFFLKTSTEFYTYINISIYQNGNILYIFLNKVNLIQFNQDFNKISLASLILVEIKVDPSKKN